MVERTNAEVPVKKNIVQILIMFLLSPSAFASSMGTVEDPKNCTQCGMDRVVFAQSRMLVVYGDKKRVGVCSIHCAAAELQHNSGKQVSSLMVADFYTKRLLDARTAVWVVGGKKTGVMTAEAKWAFAKREDALRFVKENGGGVNSFDKTMNSAVAEVMEHAAEERAVESEMLHELRQ